MYYRNLVQVSAPIDCIDIKNVRAHDLNKKAVNPLDVLRHAVVSEDKIFNKNIVYELNKDIESFKDLFKTDVIKNEKLASQQTDNSCFINLIHTEYYHQFEKLKPDGKRYFKELTREYLMEILNLDPTQTTNIGLSINCINGVSFLRVILASCNCTNKLLKINLE